MGGKQLITQQTIQVATYSTTIKIGQFIYCITQGTTLAPHEFPAVYTTKVDHNYHLFSLSVIIAAICHLLLT